MTLPRLDDRGLPPGYALHPELEVSPREVKRLLDSGEPMLLIDCRTTQEREIARIEGTLHVPMQDLSRHLDSLRPHEETPIVIHCHHGGRSLKMAVALRQAGFSDVRSMAGGIGLWSADIDRSIPSY
jgi:rhodanese-related sulfurtransferase